jgi:hypothetical protein
MKKIFRFQPHFNSFRLSFTNLESLSREIEISINESPYGLKNAYFLCVTDFSNENVNTLDFSEKTLV